MAARYAVIAMFVGFSGGAFAQTAPPPQAYVVDSTGKTVGRYLKTNIVLIQTTGSKSTFLSAFSFNRTGFVTQDISYDYATTNCTGTKYFRDIRFSLPQTGFASATANLLAYADIDRIGRQTLLSYSYLYKGSLVCGQQNVTQTVQPALTLDVDFKPPFKAIQR